jgi:DNA-damage-inducible protein J
MSKTCMVRARVEPKAKRAAEKILAEVGMSLSEAVRLLCHQIQLRHGLPFEARIPNKETLEAMDEPITHLPRFKTSAELFKELAS